MSSRRNTSYYVNKAFVDCLTHFEGEFKANSKGGINIQMKKYGTHYGCLSCNM